MKHTIETIEKIRLSKLGKKRLDMVGNTFRKGISPANKKSKFIKICMFCKKEMWVAGWNLFRKNFCSKDCHNKYRIGMQLSEKHRNKIKEALKFAIKYRDESKRPKGENHWKWIKDRTKLAKHDERNDYAYLEWMKKCKIRDNYKCRINNNDCDGKLEVHHILGWKSHPELRYEINNGITLCHAHHPKRRAEEKRLIPFLQELVSVSN